MYEKTFNSANYILIDTVDMLKISIICCVDGHSFGGKWGWVRNWHDH